ncbi:MAG: hypothetical protein C0478_14080 [Planctomyces sp.]|nr:hypothetical protein [Planctomyces sp.]
MAERVSVSELRDRFAECARHYGGLIPHDAGLVWDGYIAALLEWRLITVMKHDELAALLPQKPGNPVLGVFLGWGQDFETLELERRHSTPE